MGEAGYRAGPRLANWAPAPAGPEQLQRGTPPAPAAAAAVSPLADDPHQPGNK